MVEFLTPARKGQELEASLQAHDDYLAQRYGQDMISSGKCLLLGRHYARSPYIYFSLNPGFARDGSVLDLGSWGEFNVPFANSKELKRQYVYLKNCERFLSDYAELGTWMNAGVTSAFLVPWRTRTISELYALNRRSRGELFDAARQLVRLIMRHHKARLFLAAGKSSIRLLNDLGLPDRPIQVDRFLGPGGSYQWSRTEMAVNGDPLTVLQIPHFSRANSPAKLRALGHWLSAELKPFDVCFSPMSVDTLVLPSG